MYWVRESKFSSSAINLENIKNIIIKYDGEKSARIHFDKIEQWYFHDKDKAFEVYTQLIQGTYPSENTRGLKL